jgi:hypothetical protein
VIETVPSKYFSVVGSLSSPVAYGCVPVSSYDEELFSGETVFLDVAFDAMFAIAL